MECQLFSVLFWMKRSGIGGELGVVIVQCTDLFIGIITAMIMTVALKLFGDTILVFTEEKTEILRTG